MSSKPFVIPAVLIDLFMGNAQRAFAFESPGDLVGAPFPAKKRLDDIKILLARVRVSARETSLGWCTPTNRAGSVGAVGNMTATALKLPVDRAWVPVQGLGDLAHTESLQTKLLNAYSVLQGELSENSHRCSPLLPE